MNKRILAAALTAALFFTIVLTVMADENENGEKSPDFSTMLSVVSSDGETTRQYRSYAFVENGKTDVKWKEIKASDLTLGMEWDISRLIKKPGRLILSTAAANSNTAKKVSDCVSTPDSAVEYTIYTITKFAPNPSGNLPITYTEDYAYVNIGAGNEWSKDGYTWNPAASEGPSGTDSTAKWCRVDLSASKQTITVRGQSSADDAGNITFPSVKTAKVAVPAIAKAPKVRIYASEAVLSAKAGLEISNDGQTWARMSSNTLPLGKVTNLPSSVAGNPSVPIDLTDKSDVYVRTPATGSKPHSDVFETHIRISHTGSVGIDDFSSAPKQQIIIDSAVTIEAMMGGKWKQIKKLTAGDIPASGLRVRRAGTKERLPGPESILTLVSQDGVRVLSLTEAQ